MLKGLLLGLLVAAGAAHAETINLQVTDCTATNICFGVPNDAGAEIDYISNATQYHRLLVSIAGEVYDSGLWAVYGPLVSVPLYAPNGDVLVATLNFQVTVGKCVRSGRATVCPRYVVLTSGTLVLP